MKISTEIDSIAKLVGEEKALELVAKAGFDCWDFSMFEMCNYNWQTKSNMFSYHPLANDNYREFAKHLKKISDDLGIECNQSHAPFPTYVPEVCTYLKRAIECTAIVGGKICVIHPDNFKSAEENAVMYNELLPFAKECNVKIATENMWDWDCEKDQAYFNACANEEDFLKHIKAVNDDYFVACLDIGHAEMRGLDTSSVKMINTLGKHLQALHIHDNDCWHDDHQIPFSMDIKFEPIVKALKDIDYTGEFTLEANGYMSKFTKENVFEGVKNLEQSVRKLADMFENCR